MTHTPEQLRRGYFYALAVIIIWSGFVIVSRLGGKSAFTPYDMIALRYTAAGIGILPLWMRHRTALFERRKILLTLLGALGFTLFAFNGFRHAPANHAAILLQGFLPFTVGIMAYFMAGERPSRQRLLGLGFIALGVASMAVESFASRDPTLLGDSLLIGASLCWAAYTVLLRRWELPPMDSAIAVTLLSGILYLPVYALFLPKNLGAGSLPEYLVFAIYQGIIVAIIQMICYTRAVALLGATRLAMLTSCVPVLASLAAVPLLGEPLTPLVCLGLVLVVVGAWVGNRRVRLSPSLGTHHDR